MGEYLIAAVKESQASARLILGVWQRKSLKEMKFVRKTKRLCIRQYLHRDYLVWREAISTMLPMQNRWDIAAQDRSDSSRRAFEQILQSQKMLRNNDLSISLGIFLLDGTLIGNVSLMNISRGMYHNADLGYRIFNRYWGRGFGTDGAQAGVDIAFRDLKLHRIEAKAPPLNSRSIRILRALKFRKEGRSKKRLFFEGEWHDLDIYALTTEDAGLLWQGRKKRK